MIHNEPARRGSGPCSVLKWSTEGGKITLFVGFSTGKVASFSLEGGNLRKESAVSFGVAVSSYLSVSNMEDLCFACSTRLTLFENRSSQVNCLVYSEGILLVGCADGGLRLIPVRNGVQFDSKPSLWNAVNNKNSPGISSINITFTTGTDGAGRCICCSGGEDGSVALFELKRILRSSFM